MKSAMVMDVAYIAVSLFLALICVAIGFGPRPSKALRLLGIGGILSFVSTLQWLASIEPLWLSPFLHALATLLTAGGLIASSRWKLGWRALVGSVALVFPLVALSVLGKGPEFLHAMASPKTIADVCFTFAALVLIVRPPREATLAAYVLGGGLLLMG
jgi:hypothetical protein